jgi:hypothetical protein
MKHGWGHDTINRTSTSTGMEWRLELPAQTATLTVWAPPQALSTMLHICQRMKLPRAAAVCKLPLGRTSKRVSSSAVPVSAAPSSSGSIGSGEGPVLNGSMAFVQSNEKKIAYWLLGMSGLVAGMVTVGGITRLTRSGLSMTGELKDIG